MSAERTTGRVSFRRLTEADVPLLHRWLNAPHVLEWWDRPPAQDEVRAKYLPRIAGSSDVTPYVILLEDAPLGYIQVYPVAPGAWGLRGVAAGAGVDLLIGEAEYLHRGLGPRTLRAFLGEVVFRDTAVSVCYIDPSTRNRAAIRAFEKAGFRYVADVTDPNTGLPLHLMRITREESPQGV
jgi:RimJ/RimL family protein N-acetyltransferase